LQLCGNLCHFYVCAFLHNHVSLPVFIHLEKMERHRIPQESVSFQEMRRSFAGKALHDCVGESRQRVGGSHRCIVAGQEVRDCWKEVIGWRLCRICDRSNLTSNSMTIYVDVYRGCVLLIVLIDQIVKPEQKTHSCWSIWNKSEANKHSSGGCASLFSPIIWNLVLGSTPSVGLISFDSCQKLSRLM
jgi:hypothetical protein